MTNSQLKAFYGQPSFLARFGTPDPNGNPHISADWQGGLSNAVSAGQVCGLLVSVQAVLCLLLAQRLGIVSIRAQKGLLRSNARDDWHHLYTRLCCFPPHAIGG